MYSLLIHIFLLDTRCYIIIAIYRFIFFEKEMDSTSHLEDSFKESRKQLCAVATTLHMLEEDAAELIVGSAMVDFRDVQEDEEQQDVDESRYEDESRFEDGQQGYDDYDSDDDSSHCHSDSEILMSPNRYGRRL